MPSLPEYRAVRAFFRRELRASLLNRSVHVFSVVALLAGIAPQTMAMSSRTAAPFLLLQVILYLLPLFALLIGTGSAQSDQEERAFLFSQPASRSASLLGKFGALWLLLGVITGLLVLPSALGDTDLSPLGFLWLHAIGISGVFLAIGLACGYSTSDRVKAHLAALSVWLLLLAGTDLIALVDAHTAWMQDRPGIWVASLMANPLDALRIGAMFAVDQIPLDRGMLPAVVSWWMDHPVFWFATITLAWISIALVWSRHRLEKLSF